VSLLTDRASALREFFRLVNADASDDDLTEHDATTLEGAYEALDVGAARAQLFLIRIGQGESWLTTGAALTVTGADPNRYSALPADFLRLDSEETRSGLTYASGLGWGREILPNERNRVRGNFYWVEKSAATSEYRIRYASGAAVPAGVVPQYYRRVEVLADSTDMELMVDDRNLVPAFAADYAKEQSWFAGGDEQRSAISRHLRSCQAEAYTRGRPSRNKRRVESEPVRGQWIL
jgi:hypothetical protein